MAQTTEAARARAEAIFKRADAPSGPAATRQDAETLAVQEKTARLRALRIAKEELERKGRDPAR